MLFECMNSIYDLSTVNIVDLTRKGDKFQIAIGTTGDPSFGAFESFLSLPLSFSTSNFICDILVLIFSEKILHAFSFEKNYYSTFPFVLMFYSPSHYFYLMLFAKRYFSRTFRLQNYKSCFPCTKKVCLLKTA